MSSKIKLVIAIVFFVIAIAAIGYYFASTTSSSHSNDIDKALNAPDPGPEQPLN